jgi:uncharacterized membrane protein (TIGR02234 family)
MSPADLSKPPDLGGRTDVAAREPGGAQAGAGDRRRRYPIGPSALLALGAAALWASSRMTWVTLRSSDGLTEPRTHHVNGGIWFGALTPLALVLLAAILAVLSTRGWVRRLIGVVVAVAAAVAVVPGFALLTHHGKTAERAAALAELPARAHVDYVAIATGPALVSVLGAVVAFVAGVLLARMPQAAAGLSGKYDNPVFRRAAAVRQVTERSSRLPAVGASSGQAPQPDSRTPGELSERVLWDALDAGADPTDDASEK